MILAAFTFPPIDELFRWKDVLFQGTPYAINKTSIMVFVSGALIIALFVGGSRRTRLVPGRLQNMLEMTYEFVDRGITRDVIGDDAARFTPFLGALFLFILFLNLWEVVPFIQFPPTSRFAIPLYLALQTYVIYWYVGFRYNGIKYLTGHLFLPGVPKVMYVLLTPIELLQILIVRPFSLAVRLLANLMAGHILLTALALLTSYALDVNPGVLKVIAVGPFLLNIGVTAFEILVSFLQAYIFTLLTAVYLADSLHPEH